MWKDLCSERIDALVKGYHSGIQYVRGHGESFVQLDEKAAFFDSSDITLIYNGSQDV